MVHYLLSRAQHPSTTSAQQQPQLQHTIEMTGKTPPYRLKSYQQSDSGSVTGNGRKPHLINQFSHIGDEEDEIATAQDNQSSILLCCHRAHRKGFTAVCLGLIVIALFGLNVYRVRSPVATSSQYKSCPIQESYFVSSELMGLKNSCTGELIL